MKRFFYSIYIRFLRLFDMNDISFTKKNRCELYLNYQRFIDMNDFWFTTIFLHKWCFIYNIFVYKRFLYFERYFIFNDFSDVNYIRFILFFSDMKCSICYRYRGSIQKFENRTWMFLDFRKRCVSYRNGPKSMVTKNSQILILRAQFNLKQLEDVRGITNICIP